MKRITARSPWIRGQFRRLGSATLWSRRNTSNVTAIDSDAPPEKVSRFRGSNTALVLDAPRERPEGSLLAVTSTMRSLFLGCFVLAILPACAGDYCQIGPKSGTQCYSPDETEWQETQVQGDGDSSSSKRIPAPGAVR
ncbi:MAG TPA: hypothetical protein VH142_27405 [Polyangiaceae bacterium]|jgi:hypothetical protein|nr:hypothetical protein [Polyangiaceae bacterium]